MLVEGDAGLVECLELGRAGSTGFRGRSTRASTFGELSVMVSESYTPNSKKQQSKPHCKLDGIHHATGRELR